MLMAADKFEGTVKVHTRKSMKKFEVDPTRHTLDLEVVRLATYAPGFLNKQVILVLWSNGVSGSLFRQLQKDYVQKLKNYYCLQNLGIKHEYPEELFQAFRFIQKKLSQMHEEGEDYFNDPFIKPLIKIICFNRFREVRKRFRIHDEFC